MFKASSNPYKYNNHPHSIKLKASGFVGSMPAAFRYSFMQNKLTARRFFAVLLASLQILMENFDTENAIVEYSHENLLLFNIIAKLLIPKTCSN